MNSSHYPRCPVDGLSYRQLDYWVSRGYLKPGKAKPGPGYDRTWPPEEIRVAEMMAHLVAAGVKPAAAHRAARNGGELAPGVRVLIEEADRA